MQKQPLRVFCEKGALKNFANSTGKHLCWVFFNGVADLKACNFIKKRHQHRCCLARFAKCWKTSILKMICEWLLLKRVQDLHLLFTCIHKHMIPYTYHRLHNCTILIDLLSLTIYILARDKYNNNVYAGDIVCFYLTDFQLLAVIVYAQNVMQNKNTMI